MAKSQNRPNKEVRKPKKEVPKKGSIPAASVSTAFVKGGKGGKKG